MYAFVYTWIYLVNGHMGTQVGYFENRNILKAKLNEWNRQGRETWKYVETPENEAHNNIQVPNTKLPPRGQIGWFGASEHHCIYGE